jgi:hypothetical protein
LRFYDRKTPWFCVVPIKALGFLKIRQMRPATHMAFPVSMAPR